MVFSGRFGTLPTGSHLPSGGECAARVRRSPWEPRPDNGPANHTVVNATIKPWAGLGGGLDARAAVFGHRVDGAFTGTTDEIIQWGACKWGLDEDIVRATAINESNWRMSELGDETGDASQCTPGFALPCPLSFGLLQVKHNAHPGTYPMSRQSTAFNLDYTLAVRRTCFEGWTSWLYQYGSHPYGGGDEWGCVGFWYSGDWHDQGAENYIAAAKRNLAEKPWLRPGF